jgi:hypothetical protein
MGYTTDYIGHIDIEPGLNEAELAYLIAFSESRRCVRTGDPYAVPDDPRADDRRTFPGNTYHVPPEGQPGLWCDWVPCWDGCCLAYNGVERFYGGVTWLHYLIDHFLKPGAAASRSGDPTFSDFGFDHVLEGLVVGCRRDNKELFAIEVKGNRVREKVLRATDRSYLDYPPLAYETVIDRNLSTRQRRRRERGSGAAFHPEHRHL